jgi:hypothetical protein
MKRVCFISALALLCAGAVFGQSGKKNALGVDAAPFVRSLVATEKNPNRNFLGAGLFYERLFGSRYSLGGRFDFISGKYANGPAEVDVNYLAGSIHGRVYPLGQGLAKLYLDLGIGYNSIDIDLPGADREGLTFSLKAGYKHFFNSTIFVEPSLVLFYGESIANGAPALEGLRDPSPFGLTPGLLIGVSF